MASCDKCGKRMHKFFVGYFCDDCKPIAEKERKEKQIAEK